MQSTAASRRKSLRHACATAIEALEQRVLLSSSLISGLTSTNEGAAYTLNFNVLSQGSSNAWTVDWNDGQTSSVAGNLLSKTHTFTDGPATRTITASIGTLSNPLDSTFDANGIESDDLGSASDEAQDIAIQSDGKIVLVGGNGFSVARYTTAGTLDTTFGTGGKIATTGTDSAYAVAIQPDGKILVGGGQNFALARFNSDGTLDTTFGNGTGKSSSGFGPSYSAYGMTLLSNGKIILVGNNSSTNFIIARFNSDGTVDSTFGTSGKTSTDFNTSYDYAYSVAEQSDGKLFVAGRARTTGGDYDFALARYTASGSLDTGFGTGGKVTTDFGSTDDSARKIAIQSDGKIVVAGYTNSSATGGYDFALARYNSNGTLDTSFGTSGKLTTDFGQGGDKAYALKILSDGRIVAAGRAQSSSNSMNFGVAVYTSAGALDTTFGTGGKASTDFNGSTDNGDAAAIDSDGRLIVAGSASTVGSSGASDFAIARYWLSHSASLVVSVNNVAPTLSISGDDTVSEDSSYRLYLNHSDPGSDTIDHWTVDWNDGTVQTVTGSPSSVLHTFATAGNYAITATATDEDGTYTSGNSNILQVLLAPPTTPTYVISHVVSSTQVNLSWHDNADNEDGYVIQRSANGSEFATIATIAANSTTYSDTGLDSSATYIYRVLASNGAGISDTGTDSGGVTDAVHLSTGPNAQGWTSMSEGSAQANNDGSTTVNMGMAGVAYNDHQESSISGSSIQLTGGGAYDITLTYDLHTWDSYSPEIPWGSGNQHDGGYWDLFSFSLTDQPYSSVAHSDPITAAFTFGGGSYRDQNLESRNGTYTFHVTPNDDGKYLNIILDTATEPFAGVKHPSWGSVTVVSNQNLLPKVSLTQKKDAYEGGPDGGFRVERTGPATSSLTVQLRYYAVGGPSSNYYSIPATTITLAPGESFRDLPFHAINDHRVNPAGEGLMAVLKPTADYVIGGGSPLTMLVKDNSSGSGGGGGGFPGGGGILPPGDGGPDEWVDVEVNTIYPYVYTGQQGETWYGSTGDGTPDNPGGPGLTTGQYETISPVSDPDNVPWSSNVFDFNVTKASVEDSDAGSTKLTWDESRTKVWKVIAPAADGDAPTYQLQHSGWTISNAELQDPSWGWLGGIGGLVEPIKKSDSFDDAYVTAEFTPDAENATTVKDTAKFTIMDVEPTAHRTGLKFGEVIPSNILEENDPKKFIVLTNNDIEEGSPDYARDFDNETADISKDDDLVHLTLPKLPSGGYSGTFEIELSDPTAIRIFESDGSLLFDGLTSSTPLTLNLSAPDGYLSNLLHDDTDIYFEALKPSEDFTLSTVFKNKAGSPVASSAVHMEFDSWTFGGIAAGTMGVVAQATKTEWDSQSRLYYGVGNTDASSGSLPFSIGPGEHPPVYTGKDEQPVAPNTTINYDEGILRQATRDKIQALLNDSVTPGQITADEAATIDLTNSEAMHIIKITGMGLPETVGSVRMGEMAYWATDWVAANPGKTVDDYYQMRQLEYNVMRARIGIVKTTIPAVNLYTRLVGPTADLITISVMAPVSLASGGARLVEAAGGSVDVAAATAASQATRWADEFVVGEQASLIREMKTLAGTLSDLPTRAPTMVSGASDIGTLAHYYEYSGFQATPSVVSPGNINPTLSLRIRAIQDTGVESLTSWRYIPNCAEFKLLNNALWGGVPEDGLIMGTLRVSDFTLQPRCNNCDITVEAPRFFGPGE